MSPEPSITPASVLSWHPRDMLLFYTWKMDFSKVCSCPVKWKAQCHFNLTCSTELRSSPGLHYLLAYAQMFKTSWDWNCFSVFFVLFCFTENLFHFCSSHLYQIGQPQRCWGIISRQGHKVGQWWGTEGSGVTRAGRVQGKGLTVRKIRNMSFVEADGGGKQMNIDVVSFATSVQRRLRCSYVIELKKKSKFINIAWSISA